MIRVLHLLQLDQSNSRVQSSRRDWGSTKKNLLDPAIHFTARPHDPAIKTSRHRAAFLRRSIAAGRDEHLPRLHIVDGVNGL